MNWVSEGFWLTDCGFLLKGVLILIIVYFCKSLSTEKELSTLHFSLILILIQTSIGEYYQTPKIARQQFPKRAWILITELDFLVYDFWTIGVNSMGQSETSDVTEQQPLRKLSKFEKKRMDIPFCFLL